MFPIAPLYVRRHGGSSLDIALFIAGPLIANTLVQVPAGRLTDRIGRRPMLLGSRAAFGLLAFALFADAGPLWLLHPCGHSRASPRGHTSPGRRARSNPKFPRLNSRPAATQTAVTIPTP